MSVKYDNILLDLSTIGELPHFPPDKNPNKCDFQSQTLDSAFMLRSIILSDDGIYVEDFTLEKVPIEDRPAIKEKNYDNPQEEASELDKSWGSLRKVKQRYDKYEYHGLINFYTSIDGIKYEYEAKYTDGKLEEVQKVKPE